MKRHFKLMVAYLWFCGLVGLWVCPQIIFAQGQTYPTKPVYNTNANYFLHTGFMFDAVLKTAIFSFNSITPVVAETEYDIRFLEKVMIPRGTKFIGQCNVEKTVNRVNITFTTMVFPNGQEIQFNGIALHTDGSGGVPGKIVKASKNTLPAKVLLNATASSISSVSGNSIVSDITDSIQQSSQSELNEVYSYYIEISKNVPIQVFVKGRLEY